MKQKEQAKELLQKYGLSSNEKYTAVQIVTILKLEMKEQIGTHIKKLEDFIKTEFGKRCPDVEKDCVVCKAYKLLDEAKKLTK